LDITFGNRSLEKACNSAKQSDRRWGAENGKRIRQRLEDLAAFSCLADVPSRPPFRCHPLKGDRQGQLAVDVKHPYRLIFEPDHEPVPKMADGGIDLRRVTAIRVLGVEDYHGD